MFFSNLFSDNSFYLTTACILLVSEDRRVITIKDRGLALSSLPLHAEVRDLQITAREGKSKLSTCWGRGREQESRVTRGRGEVKEENKREGEKTSFKAVLFHTQRILSFSDWLDGMLQGGTGNPISLHLGTDLSRSVREYKEPELEDQDTEVSQGRATSLAKQEGIFVTLFISDACREGQA